MESCPDCGTNLDRVALGSPCPSCDGDRRDGTAFAPTVHAVGSVPPPVILTGSTMTITVTTPSGTVLDPAQDLQPAAHFATSQDYYVPTPDNPAGMYTVEDATGTMPPEVFTGTPEQIAKQWVAWFLDDLA